jgi:hypothetical protein
MTTTNKALNEPASGALNWNTPLNANFAIIDTALGASVSISLTGLTTYAVSSVQAQNMSLNFTGTPAVDVTVTLPTGVGGQWVIRNTTTKGLIISSLAGGAGTTTIPASSIRSIYCDGTNVYFADAQGIGSNTQVAFTSGGVLTGSNDLTFNGALLSLGASNAVTGGSTGGTTTAVITFVSSPVIPVGSTVIVTGVTPTAYNGTWTVTASTDTSVTYTVPVTIANAGAGGAVAYGTFRAGGTVVSMPNLNESRTAGVTTVAVDDGTKTTGTYTPAPAGGNMRRIVNAAGTTATTAASCVTTTASVTYAGSFSFTVGSTVVVSGVTPAGYNGTWVVTASSAGSVSYAVPVTLAAATVQGLVTSGFFLAAPTASGDYTMLIQITNNASAGAVTFTGFNRTAGDALTLTNGNDFFLFITKCNGFVSGIVQALQ